MKQEPKQDIEIFIDGIVNPAEPNQALIDAAQRYEKYSERFDNDESAIGNPETWGKRVLTEEDIFNQRDIDAVTDYIGKETSKQETLEEVAIINYKKLYEGEPLTQDVPIDAFKQGAKWQQEEDKKLYSEEEVINLLYIRSMCQEHYESDAEIREWFNKFKKK
jgi:hypothetical protein